jgi:hypothetical protein
MLLEGHKRWVLFEPGTPRHLVKSDDYEGVDREAISWFQGVLPQLIDKHSELAARRIDFIQREWQHILLAGGRATWVRPMDGEELMNGVGAVVWWWRCWRCWLPARAHATIAGPGETVFVPGNWWHVVCNLDETVAVTQNFASSTNFPVVWVSDPLCVAPGQPLPPSPPPARRCWRFAS